MSKGISIHIGINKVSKQNYSGDWRLPWCVNDALAMRDIATANGYDWLLLLNEKATSVALLNALDIAAGYLKKGDILFLSFSGHGAWVKDQNGDEEDGYDEAWVMYDKKLIDDQLYESWKKFKAGTRIVVVADSCHSGSSIKPIYETDDSGHQEYEDDNPNSIWGEKWIELLTQRERTKADKKKVTSSVLLLAACDEREVIPGRSPSEHSLFTHMLLKVWDDNSFNGNYKTFLNEIARLVPQYYHPQYFVIGERNKIFERQKPFLIY